MQFTAKRRTGMAVTISILTGAVMTALCPMLLRRIFHLMQCGRLTPWYVHGIRFVVFTVVFAVPACVVAFGIRRTGMTLHRCRFTIGAVLVALAVILDISGSSLGMWNYWLGSDLSQDVIWGTPRAIRTDEYVVGTPFAFSQNYNHYGYFSSLFGNRLTDMFIIKDAPVWTLAELFRPFHWGYLLLGGSRGLAFYWSVRLVVLFLASYQMLLLLTSSKDETHHRGICCLGASMIVFAPMTQWWFTVNSLPEMLIAVFIAICCLDRYCVDARTKARALYAMAILSCAGMFILSLYPAWQVPLAYIGLALAAGVIANHWGTIHVTKPDVIIVAVLVALFVIIMAVSLFPSVDTIIATLNTEYPGSRQSTGGGYSPMFFFSSIGTLALPFKDFVANDVVHNATEASLFVDLFPLGIVLSVVNMVKRKTVDVVSVALIAVVTMLGCFACIGFPLWLSKFMLLTPVTSTRVAVAFAIGNILLLVHAVTHRSWSMRPWQVAIIAIAYASVSVLAAIHVYPAYIGWLIAGCCCIASALFTVSFIAGRGTMRLIAGVVAGTLLCISGLSVNPVQYSTNPLTNQPMIEQVQALKSRYDGMWAVSGDRSSWIANLMISNGVKTFNALQVVPDMNSWERIDPAEQWKTVYNRYAYIGISIDNPAKEASASSQSQSFELIAPDSFVFHATPSQLDKLDVRNVLSTEPLDAMSFPDGYSFARIGKTVSGWTPYRLITR